MSVDQIAATLDDVLSSSLWARRIVRQKDDVQMLLGSALKARAKYIWTQSTATQRKGYFLSGVGLTTGQQLDAIAPTANQLLVRVNGAILSGNQQQAIDAFTALAEHLFGIQPFVPEPLPTNWRDVLQAWLKGEPIAAIGGTDMNDVLRFVENGLIYKLPWGMEAIRVRAQANHDAIGDFTIDDIETGLALPAIETGTLNGSAALLMQAGFTSRLAAIKAVTDTSANFTTGYELGIWLRSDEVSALTAKNDWPTPETANLWKAFRFEYQPPEKAIWSIREATRAVDWGAGIKPPQAGEAVRIRNIDQHKSALYSAAHDYLGLLKTPISGPWRGVLLARVGQAPNIVSLSYYGPDDIQLA